MRGLTFGPPFFETEVGRVEPDAEVHFAVLLVAAVATPNVGVPRDELAELLWPGSPLEAARHSLRQSMYRLRQLGIPLHLRRGQVMLDEEDTEVDLRDLMRGPIARDDLLRIATQPFLPGYSPRVSSQYSGWVQELRDRMDRVRRGALVEAVRDARINARFRDIHKLARALLALDPLNETATLALAEALVMDGSKVEALRMLEDYEAEVGEVSESLRIPARTLRRRVSECLDEALLPRKFEVPFVGRESEFRVLREGFVSTRQGKGQCFVVTGEPGIGKTRIAQELLRLSVLDGAMVITYQCTSGDAIAPLSSLLTLTQALLGQPGALGCAAEHLQYLRRILSPEPTPPSSFGMAADVAYAQLVYSLAELTAAIAHEGPLVVFIDDAHRLHQTSWRIFSDVVDRLPDKRVLLVLAARQLPEWYGTLGINGSDGRSHHVHVPAFTPAASLSFMDLWGEKNAVDTSVFDAERVTDAAQGNPFYLGELVAHLARGGPAEELPATIKGLVGLQWAALSKGAQRALLVIGMLQSHATMSRVAAVLRTAPESFVGVLDELETAGLVGAEGTYLKMRHELITELCQLLAAHSVVQYLQSRAAARLELEGSRMGSLDLLSSALTLWEKSQDHYRAFNTSMLIGSRCLHLGLCDDALLAYERATAMASSELERALAVTRVVGALGATCHWTELTVAIERLTPALAATLPQRELDEVALWSAEAGIWLATRLSLAGLESLYRDTGRDPDVRCRAATLALISADNWLCGPEYLEENGLSSRRAAAGGRREDARRLFDLVAATALGEFQVVPDLIDRYLQLAHHLPRGERVRALRVPAYAMARSGRTLEARDLFAIALRDAEDLRLPSHIASCADQLARTSYQLGDLEAALNYTHQLRSLHKQDPSAEHVLQWAMYLDAYAAMTFEDRGLAESTCTNLLAFSTTLLSLERYSLLFAKCALSGWFPFLMDNEAETNLRTLDRRVLNRGCVDVGVIAACRSLCVLGDPLAAESLVADYFARLRVESAPPNERLWSTTRSLTLPGPHRDPGNSAARLP